MDRIADPHDEFCAEDGPCGSDCPYWEPDAIADFYRPAEEGE